MVGLRMAEICCAAERAPPNPAPLQNYSFISIILMLLSIYHQVLPLSTECRQNAVSFKNLGLEWTSSLTSKSQPRVVVAY